MNISEARLLIENLLDRIEQDPVSGKFKLGTISNREKLALEMLIGTDLSDRSDTPSTAQPR